VAVKASVKRAVAWGLLRSGALSFHHARFERGRAILLLYHRVNDERDPFFPAMPGAVFTAQLEYLSAHYRVDTLDAVLDWLAYGAPGPPRVAITFDDGYPDTHDVVLPALERVGVPATLFLSTGPPETGAPLWTDRVRALVKHAHVKELLAPGTGLPPLPLGSTAARLQALSALLARMKRLPPAVLEGTLAELERSLANGGRMPGVLDWGRIRRMARGHLTLGAHTHRHYLLSTLTDEQIQVEIATSVRLIQSRVGVKVTTFAYPNGQPGDYDQRAVRALRALGLRGALTSSHGFAHPEQDRYELSRIYTTAPTLPLFAARAAGLGSDTRAVRA
jgi:peptidoglycan/xylan/chitin deacetylase (PgdA/CDA1 family)